MSTRATWIYLLIALSLAGLYFFERHQEAGKKAERASFRTFFKINKEKLQYLTIKKGTVRIVVQREGKDEQDHWIITSPIRTDADPIAITKFIDKLATLKWTRKISEQPKDLSIFGLMKPLVVIGYKGKEESGELLIGDVTPLGDDVYVKRKQDQTVYTIAFADKFDLDVDLFDLRDKRLVTIAPNHVKKLVIDGERGRWVLTKKEDKWFFHNNHTFEASRDKVYAILSRLATTKASRIVEESAKDLRAYGLDRPRMKVQVSDGNRIQGILLGAPDKEDEGDLYAKMLHKPQVITVKRWILSDVPLNADGFKK
ncbi:MAG: hypothetical protein DRG63_07040 [Deltaproteobacteria bacterium]|nr:MAG: hypothetical protein DRG63_07040 [Deltaproteobacteria bacterium]